MTFSLQSIETPVILVKNGQYGSY